MDDYMGYAVLAETARDKIEKLNKALSEERLHIACLEACVLIYEQHGQRHPTTFGVCPTVSDLKKKVEAIASELAQWECARELLKQIRPTDTPLVIGGPGVR